ncbi:MAG TPA: hypothetical protein VD927_05035 [Chryseosolibacter sp.]|nr:hypothetical protein [Chryseosolibacter sp.]
MKASSTLGGLAGALALTLLNETIKKVKADAPRLDLLGQNALAKLMKGNDFMPQTVTKFFPLAGDLVTNSLFYGMAKGSDSTNTLLRGTLLGLAAGVGAVALPKQLGLPEAPTNRTTDTKILTVAWYVVGGLVAAAAINALDKALDKPKLPENKELKSGAVKVGKQVGKKIYENI